MQVRPVRSVVPAVSARCMAKTPYLQPNKLETANFKLRPPSCTLPPFSTYKGTINLSRPIWARICDQTALTNVRHPLAVIKQITDFIPYCFHILSMQVVRTLSQHPGYKRQPRPGLLHKGGVRHVRYGRNCSNYLSISYFYFVLFCIIFPNIASKAAASY